MTITIIFCPAQLYKIFSTINKYQLIRANIFLKTCNMLVFDLYIILYSWIWSPISCVYHKNQILHSNIVHFLWFLFSETMIPVNLELVNELWLPNIFIYNLKTFKVWILGGLFSLFLFISADPQQRRRPGGCWEVNVNKICQNLSSGKNEIYLKFT